MTYDEAIEKMARATHPLAMAIPEQHANAEIRREQATAIVGARAAAEAIGLREMMEALATYESATFVEWRGIFVHRPKPLFVSIKPPAD